MQDKDTSELNFNYLPAQVAACFVDALGCYRNGLLQAFAAMCRFTVQATCDDLGEKTKLKLFDQVEEIANLAGIDDLAHRTYAIPCLIPTASRNNWIGKPQP